ncbi:unnamed protein product, partial [Ostreobium quekettii]
MFRAASEGRRVFAVALCCRLAVLCLSSLLDGLLPDYDTSSELADHGPCNSGEVDGDAPSLSAIEAALGRMVVWDSLYFVRIARCGYEYEQCHAFFPGYPGILKLVTQVARAFGTRLDIHASHALAGLVISNTSFALSAVLFYKLSKAIVEVPRLCATALLLYCLPPSSVFASAVYTESLFSLATMAGLYWLFVCDSLWLATLAFSFGSAIRSNGLLHAGFVVHRTLKIAIGSETSMSQKVLASVKGALASVVVAAPFVAFQRYGYQQFCSPPHATTRPWCGGRVPYLYGFVQEHYWDVGPFKYFQTKQVPNFLLAAPVLYLSFAGVLAYMRNDWERTCCLGLLPMKGHKVGYWSDTVSPFVYEWAFMSCTATVLMNVQ